ncbi:MULTISPECIES: sensor histidine kinase [Olivibacter]|jgi:K+-sensing histidine kinase KdpD|uniref:histidine kinase n=3 Tax=Sphingobacteriaceae TaxID=84566 RepID=F4C4V2_SPHS2|nr:MULTISPECIES: ATP-binding protein [Olivibacter]MCL4639590.1 ATP-binding protein [Olivibacter sp. UJ_SKK_5.1]MDM8173892.1 ATP-binding protein [Olivibacter sp. 47]MDX3915076.1 ATP-binding protein [Pseudosphingobacterium sp.]QEL03680.1 two-component sensor histidine kinase [Olivibacter sp. LS-1]
MRKPLFLFYFLVFYAIAQIVWWGMLLMELEPLRKGMVIGEGFIFMTIFLVGAIKLKRAFVHEHKTHKQQHNFLLSVTHELKSPLASIKLYIQTILKRDLNKEQRDQFLSNSLKDIERLDDLVENVLLATKLESVGKSIPKEEFDFSELTGRIADRLQVHSCTSQIIKTDIQPNIFFVGDKLAITSVVTNLIENAIKYSPPCAHVNVRLYKQDGQIRFSVADLGIGINDEEKKRIFNKFYRVGSEDTRKTKGTGLGLYIVKSVLDKHNAQIKVLNNTPTGSIFDVTFN